MDLTIFLAQIMGVYILVSGLSGLLYGERMQKALTEATKSYLLPYFDGAIALIVGLIVVLTHNIWTGSVATLVTLIGWIILIEGFAMLLLPHKTLVSFAQKFSSKQMAMGWSVLAVIVGAFLTYQGFFV